MGSIVYYTRADMVKRIQCFLTDAEALEMEKAKDRLGETSDYGFVKLAILKFCKDCDGHGADASKVEEKGISLSRFDEGYMKLIQALKSVKGVCANCGLPILDVSQPCPRCGHTKYAEV